MTCVGIAETIATTIAKFIEPNKAIGLLFRWYRIYNLHNAGITLVAAMLGDLFTKAVSQSWNSMSTSLYKIMDFSEFIPQCTVTYEALSERIVQTRYQIVNHDGTRRWMMIQQGSVLTTISRI
ncbi:hypothetical protein F1880_005265 [Penicillium rolfsii]|nr:hypothetical protein F1880_005265 [Penicillium rolfsii]